MGSNPQMQSVESMIVRCPNWVGDLVMATPTFDCLRQNFPTARIGACVRPYARGVIEDGPWFNEIIDCDDTSIPGLLSAAGRIRAFGADTAVILPNSLRSLLTVRLGGVRRAYGYRRDFRSMLLTGGPRPVRHGLKATPTPMVEYYLELCRALGLTIPSDTKPRLFMSDQVRTRGAGRLAGYGIGEGDMVIGMVPGAKFGSSKCWPPEHFARLTELLQDRFKCRILLLVGPGEEGIAQRIVTQSGADIVNTASDKFDLAALKPLIARCDLLIANDTGPRHYGTAFDVPMVVIMGSTDPRHTASHLDKTIVIRKDLDCSPCHKKICPTDHACMVGITAAQVFEQAETLLLDHSPPDRRDQR